MFTFLSKSNTLELAASCYPIEIATKTYQKTFTARTKPRSGPAHMGIIALLLSIIHNTGFTLPDMHMYKRSVLLQPFI